MPFDITKLPKIPEKARLPAGTPKKEDVGSRTYNKRHMLADITRDRRLLESKLALGDLPENRSNPYIKRYSPKEAEELRRENEYDNFLKRMIFKIHSVGGGKPFGEGPREKIDERNTANVADAGAYHRIWKSLTDAEKDQVIAASGHPEYKNPAKLSKYMPKVPHKSQAENPEYNFGVIYGDNRKEKKIKMLEDLSTLKRHNEDKIENKGIYYRPGKIPTKEQAEELRKDLEREIFKKRKLFKLERGRDKRHMSARYNSDEFSNLWGAMSPAEQDEYIGQETVGMSPALIRKKYGVPSLIDELPAKPAKKVSVDQKKTGEGSRAFEKEKLLSEIKSGDEKLRQEIGKGTIKKENAANAIREHEYENFLKRQKFKFYDTSHQSALAKNPFIPKTKFNREEEREKIKKQHLDYVKQYPQFLTTTRNGRVGRITPEEYIDTIAETIATDLGSAEARYNKSLEPFIAEHNAKIPKDPLARTDLAGANAYADIWNKLTPGEKNQVMQAEAYTPRGMEYYMPPEPVQAPPLEQKVLQEQVIAPAVQPNLFQAPIPEKEYAESQRRLKEERKYRREAKEQLELWNSLTPQQKQEAKLVTQLGEYNQLARQAPMLEMQAMFQNQGVPYGIVNQMPPAMMQELMQAQNQPIRQIPVRARKSVYDRIMSSFDPNLFSPEFMQEEM